MRTPPRTNTAPRPNQNQYSGRNNNASQGGNRGGHPAASTGNHPRGYGRIEALVNATINSGVDDLRKERRIARRQAKKDRNQAKTDYNRGLSDLNYIYGEVGDYVGAMGGQINQNYNDLASRTAAAQTAFTQQLQANSQNVADGLGTELGRLGLSGIDNSQFAADASNALNVAGQTGVNNMANIGLQQQGSNAISSLLGGMVQGSHLSQVGQQRNNFNDRMSEIYQNKHDAYDKIAEAITDLKSTRNDLTLQMMQQLANSPWGRYLMGKHKNGSGSSNSGGSSGGSYGGSSYTPSSTGSSGGYANTPGTKPNSGNALTELLLNALNGPR